jgi:hypothetical protein
MKIEIIPRYKQFEDLIAAYPPQHANRFIPEWFKEMKLGNEMASFLEEFHDVWTENAFTAKKCPAIQDLMTEGIIIPLWGKMYMGHEYDDEGNPLQTYYGMTTNKALNYNFFGSHFEKQVKGMDVGLADLGRMNKSILKLESPYKIIVPEGYNLLYVDPFYHFRKEIRLLEGLVEADKWGYITFPFSIQQKEFILEAGTPLIQVIPYKREKEKIDLTIRNGTEKEYKDNQIELLKAQTARVNYKTYPDKFNQ